MFSTALMLLATVFVLVSTLYALSSCQKGNKTTQVHHSPLLTFFTCGKHGGNNLADHSHMSYIAALVQCLLVILYFVGNNLGPLVETHGSDLGCIGTCSEYVSVFTKVTSVAATLLFHLAPYLLHHCVKASKNLEYVIEKEKTLLGLLGNIVKVNSAYMTLTGFVQLASYCSYVYGTRVEVGHTQLLYRWRSSVYHGKDNQLQRQSEHVCSHVSWLIRMPSHDNSSLPLPRQ